jgi:hypothetical protein
MFISQTRFGSTRIHHIVKLVFIKVSRTASFHIEVLEGGSHPWRYQRWLIWVIIPACTEISLLLEISVLVLVALKVEIRIILRSRLYMVRMVVYVQVLTVRIVLCGLLELIAVVTLLLLLLLLILVILLLLLVISILLFLLFLRTI